MWAIKPWSENCGSSGGSGAFARGQSTRQHQLLHHHPHQTLWSHPSASWDPSNSLSVPHFFASTIFSPPSLRQVRQVRQAGQARVPASPVAQWCQKRLTSSRQRSLYIYIYIFPVQQDFWLDMIEISSYHIKSYTANHINQIKLVSHANIISFRIG